MSLASKFQVVFGVRLFELNPYTRAEREKDLVLQTVQDISLNFRRWVEANMGPKHGELFDVGMALNTFIGQRMAINFTPLVQEDLLKFAELTVTEENIYNILDEIKKLDKKYHFQDSYTPTKVMYGIFTVSAPSAGFIAYYFSEIKDLLIDFLGVLGAG